MAAEIREFGPLLGAGGEPVSVADVGAAPKIFSSSFFRGDHCNIFHNTADFDRDDFIEHYVLKGWIPTEPFLSEATRITTFGSCFALNIAKHLSGRGYDLSHKRAPDIYISQMAEGLVNCHSLLQQFEWALEGAVPPANLWHGYKTEDYGYNQDIQRKTRDVLLNTDFFIVTLGLSEVWYDAVSGGVLWRAVPLRHFDPARHRFRVCSIAETKAALQRMFEIVRKHIPRAKLLFTLSPIPLAATFRPSSCLVANSASKAILRAALDEVMREAEAHLNRDLFYFPSYEMINELFFNKFESDLRHPPDYILDAVMRAFDASYCVGEPPLTAISELLRATRARNAGEATGGRFSRHFSFPARDARLHTIVGDKQADLIVVDRGKAGWGLFGPYIDLPPGNYLARVEFQWDRPIAGDATLDVCCEGGTPVAQMAVISTVLAAQGMTAEIAFETGKPLSQVEVRLLCSATFRGSIRRVEISAI